MALEHFYPIPYNIDSQKHEEKGTEPMERKPIPVGHEDRPNLVLRYGVCILKKVGATWSWPLDFFSVQW